MEDDSAPRPPGLGAILVAVVMVGSAIGALGWYWATNRKGLELNVKGFDVSAVAAPSAPVQNSAVIQPQDSMLIQSEKGMSFADGSENAPARPSGPSAAKGPLSAADRRNAAAFLMRHGDELVRYHQRLGTIAVRYYKNSPAVRRVDHDFTRMPRYMEVKRQYEQNGNPFEFVRGAISLPEVRTEISQRMSDPGAWAAAISMVNDALKYPPPPALYKEAQQFMTQDPGMSGYLPEFTKNVTQNMPIMAQSIPPGTNVVALQKVVGDVSPGSASASPH
jgi:hypothetical protein